MYYCKVTMIGHLTRDPELKYTPSGQPIAGFTLGLNRVYTSQDGNKKEEASFIDVTAFGKQAETIAQYLRKGRPLLVSGRLRQEKWEDKTTGKQQSKVTVVCEDFTFIDSKPDGETAPPAGQRGAPAQGKPAARSTEQEAEDDDVPF